MSLFESLLGAKKDLKGVTGVFDSVKGYVDIAVTVFWSLIATLILFYAIYLGWRLAKAEDDSARKDAKQQLLWSIIGLVGAIIVAVLMGTVNLATTDIAKTAVGANSDDVTLVLDDAISMANSIIGIIFKIIAAFVGIFCMYLAWRMVKAEDDSSRKEAKRQLMWAILAVVAIVVVQYIADLVLTKIMAKSYI